MKSDKVIFWLTTAIISIAMLYSAFSYFTTQEAKDVFMHLGFPDYFRVELGLAKAIGALVLLIPALPIRLKEFAYAGFTIAYTSAIIAHLSSGDPFLVVLKAVVLLVILAISFIYMLKIGKFKSDNIN